MNELNALQQIATTLYLAASLEHDLLGCLIAGAAIEGLAAKRQALRDAGKDPLQWVMSEIGKA